MQNTAFRFRLIAIFLFGFALSANAKNLGKNHHHSPIRDDRSQKQQSTKQMWIWPLPWQSPWATLVTEQHTPAADNHQHSDEQSEHGKDDDLYTKRNTEAAEKQADFAERQYPVGIFGTAVGALAAFFTGWAAWQAGKAAKYAADAVSEARYSAKISEEALSHQKAMSDLEFRPWLDFTAELAQDIAININQQTIVIWLKINITNSGMSPATAVDSHYIVKPSSAYAIVFNNEIEQRFAELNNSIHTTRGDVVFPNSACSLNRYATISITRWNETAKYSHGKMQIFGGVTIYYATNSGERKITYREINITTKDGSGLDASSTIFKMSDLKIISGRAEAT